MKKLTAFIGDTEYRFEFIAYKDPAELDVHSATMRLPEEIDPWGEWHESNLLPADHERIIFENQRDWVEMPTAAKVEINWAEKVRDKAKEKPIY